MRYEAQLEFREDKATEAAELLLELRGGRMSYVKLLKLMYLADRYALQSWGRPISFDAYYSLPNGPILSTTLDLIHEEESPGEALDRWHSHIQTHATDHEVSIKQGTSKDRLSQAEREALQAIFAEHGEKSRWELVELTHKLPEYRRPEGRGRVPITVREILLAGGWEEEDVVAALDDLAAENGAYTNWSR